jgi:hypothetical protein
MFSKKSDAKVAPGPATPDKGSGGGAGMLGGAASLGGKAVGAAFAAKSAAEGAVVQAKVAGAVAAGMATEHVYDKLSDDTKAKVGAAADKAAAVGGQVGGAVQDAAVTAAQSALDGAKEGAKQAEEMDIKFKARVYENLTDEQKAQADALKAGIAQTKENLKATALDHTEPVIDKLLLVVAEKVKRSATANPYMFGWVKNSIAGAVDDLWPDIQVELKDALTSTFRAPAAVDPGPALPWYHCYGRFRAFVLGHFIPYDKDVWAKLRDPLFVLLTLLTMVPVFAAREAFFALVLLLHLFPGSKSHGAVDEWQLINFIMSFKGMQFLTGGVIGGGLGGVQYMLCVNKDSHSAANTLALAKESPLLMHSCHESGPGSSDSFLLDCVSFGLNILLVWVAFLALPCSARHGAKGFSIETNRDRAKSARAAAEADTCCCGAFRVEKGRGGRLRKMLAWDLFAFCASAGLFVALNAAQGGGMDALTDSAHWQFRSNLYWAKISYALLSFPFVVFALPVVFGVLTHAKPTGYAPTGRCVPKQLAWQQEQKETA